MTKKRLLKNKRKTEYQKILANRRSKNIIIVTKNFDMSEKIGKLILKKGTKIPLNCIFSIGGVFKKRDKKTNKITKFDILEISMIHDKDFLDLVKNKSKYKDFK